MSTKIALTAAASAILDSSSSASACGVSLRTDVGERVGVSVQSAEAQARRCFTGLGVRPESGGIVARADSCDDRGLAKSSPMVSMVSC